VSEQDASVPPPSDTSPDTLDRIAAGPGSGRRRGLRGIGRVAGIVVTAVFVLAAGSVAIGLYALRGSGGTLIRMVPAGADVYVSVQLDPSAHQKLNLHALAQKFPALRGNGLGTNVDGEMNSMLRSFSPDLRFDRDVRPWLGSEVALVLGPRETHGALLLASKDDGAAASLLAKVQRGPAGRTSTWTTRSHDGVVIHVAQASASGEGGPAVSYAVLDHAVVLSDDASLIELVIDTDHGRQASLGSSANYQRTVSPLPSERLALVYVNLHDLLGRLGALAGQGLPGLTGTDGLLGMSGLGVSLSAESAGMAVDVNLPVDTSRLPAAERSTIEGARPVDPLLSWVPADAYGFLAAAGAPGAKGLGGMLTSGLGSAPGIERSLRNLGLTGPDGLANHLTGDLIVEASPESGSRPVGGALLVGTDDEVAVRRTLERAAPLLLSSFTGGSSASVSRRETVSPFGSPPGFVSTDNPHSPLLPLRPVVRWRTIVHGGVSIRSAEVTIGGQPQSVQPAYTVSDGMGILASSVAQVEAVLDAHAGGASVTTSPTYVDASSHSGPAVGSLLYVDLSQILSRATGGADSSLTANLAPLRALIAAGSRPTGRIAERAFLLIR
jgi:hypothetical protein